MPRAQRKEQGYHLKFIPQGRMNDLIELASKFPHVKKTEIALCKFIECYSMIVERRWESEDGFVPVQQDRLKAHLKLENGTAELLKALCSANFLELSTKNYKPEEHPYEYKAKFTRLDAVILYRNTLTPATNKMLQGEVVKEFQSSRHFRTKKRIRIKTQPEVFQYAEVIKKLSISEDVFRIIEDRHTEKINTEEQIIELDRENVTSHSFVPMLDKLRAAHSFVPKKFTYEIVGSIPYEALAPLKILTKQFRVSRPNPISRIYTNITNLHRDYRPFLRLNGKPLFGYDIGNSQPLIATVLFKQYSLNVYGAVKADVAQYQRDCEQKRFYEFFMAKKGIPLDDEDARGKFKGDFFKDVYFSMVTDADNDNKNWFIERYPTCYEAMCVLKGGLFSREYGQFAVEMQQVEASIIVKVNIELIRMGYDVVNIFDSILSNSEEAIEKAKELTLAEFAEYEITPRLCPVDYREKDRAAEIPLESKSAGGLEPFAGEVSDSKKEFDIVLSIPEKSSFVGLDDEYIEGEHKETNTTVYNRQYFIEKYKMSVEQAEEMYQGQFEYITRMLGT